MRNHLALSRATWACALIVVAVLLCGQVSVSVAWANDYAPGSPSFAQSDAGVWDGTADASWYSPTGKSFVIKSAEQLAGLAAITNGTAPGIARDDFTGKAITLACDIKLNSVAANSKDESDGQRNWTPIGALIQTGFSEGTGYADYDYTGCFNGTFNGAGHVIENIFRYTPDEEFGGYSGLFGALGAKAVVARVRLEGGFLYGRIAGGIAAASHVSKADMPGGGPRIDNCYSSVSVEGNGSSMRGSGGLFGGFEAYLSDLDIYQGMARITNCHNAGAVKGDLATTPIGGIAGIGSVQVRDCLNTGSISGSAGGSIVGSLMTKGCEDAGHPTGVGSFYAGSVINCNSTGSGILYRVLFKLKDDGKRETEAVTNSDDVFYLWDYPWTELPKDDMHALGKAFVAVDEGDVYHSYCLKLRWMAGIADVSSDFAITDGVEESYTTSGEPVLPKPQVMTQKGVVLTEGEDYILFYANASGEAVGDPCATGTYTVYAQGIASYTGRASRSFAVTYVPPAVKPVTPTPVPAPIAQKINVQGAKVIVKGQIYSGSALKPVPKVTLGGKTLRAGKDYAVSYKNNKNAGKASVTITGKGDYVGAKSVSFSIAKAANPVKATGKKATMAFSKKKNRALPVKKIASVRAAKGKVTYKKLSGNKKITMATTGKLTVKKGLARGVYTLKVKVTAAGTANFKAGNKTVKCTIRVK